MQVLDKAVRVETSGRNVDHHGEYSTEGRSNRYVCASKLEYGPKYDGRRLLLACKFARGECGGGGRA